jgi:hypothetical protein
MVKNLKIFLLIVLSLVHIPHTSHAGLDDNNLGQAFILGAWAFSGATLLTVGAYNLYAPKYVITIEEEKEIIHKEEFGKPTPNFTVKKTTRKIPSPYSPSWTEVLNNVAMSATGAGILACVSYFACPDAHKGSY